MSTPAHILRVCLDLAAKGRGSVGINPMVGAVLVRGDSIIAEGFHKGFGLPHAERHLLEKFEQKIDSKDTLYINLEPCCHLNKKTPPCTEIILERGVKNVVYGMKDPNPQVSGKGIEYLIKKGVQVTGPILEQECKRLNRGFTSIMTKKRPWITLKKAQTVDGRMANSDGSPLKITTPKQDAWSHAFLRARHDAILVGVGTIGSDNPSLTVRYDTAGHPHKLLVQPWRIILDPHARCPHSARVLTDSFASRTMVVVSHDVPEVTCQSLSRHGARVVRCHATGHIFDLQELCSLLITPTHDFHGISSILVEGGARTWEIFKDAGIVDEEVRLLGST